MTPPCLAAAANDPIASTGWQDAGNNHRLERHSSSMSTPSKTIAVGADDAAFELKGKIVDYLKSKGLSVEDYGVNQPDPSVFYPDVALTVAQAVAAGNHDAGFLMWGTGTALAIRRVKY